MVYSENDLMCKYVPVLLTGYETLGNQPLVADYTFKMALHVSYYFSVFNFQ